MTDIVLFGGTTEGRIISERFSEEFKGTDTKLCVCVATEYGASLIQENNNVSVHAGTMDYDEMLDFFSGEKTTLCVDATHPYAGMVTENLVHACDKLGIAYIRVVRGQMDTEIGETVDDNPTKSFTGKEVCLVNSIPEAVEFLNTTEGNIFISTGSKELECYKKIHNYRNRCVARVLSTLPVMIKCNSLGFEGKNLIAMQGPFSEEMNYQMFISNNIKWLVTKCSGKAGGFEEKCEAAIRAGASIVIIGPPKDAGKNFVGVEESLEIIKGIYL